MIIDTQNMKQVLIDFPSQLLEASNVGQGFSLANLPNIKCGKGFQALKGLSNIIVCGMGGSAIAGDLIASLLADELEIPIIVNRTYTIPALVTEKSLAFISSYSGNTEETLSAYEKIRTKTKNIICITSGGQLLAMNPPYVFKLPKGYQPRCALGWSFGAILNILQKLNLITDKSKELKETVSILRQEGKDFMNSTSTPAILAQSLKNNKLPIIYSDSRFESIARRWVNQLNENAKVMAHYNVFSELNHNEIVGFGNPEMPVSIIVLKDKSYNKRINIRIEITQRILQTKFHFVESKGESLLARMFYLIYFGDWVSYWLAIQREIDPTPVERIENLKKELAK